jgi:ribosomal protein S1
MSDDSFAALFAAQSADAQQQGYRKVHVGEMLQAVVVQIDRETIFVELDAKHQAMLDVTEMRSPDGTLAVKVGDTIRARVVSVDENKSSKPRTPASRSRAKSAASTRAASKSTSEKG